MEYVFTLKFQLGDAEDSVDVLVERLAEAGCDDALIGSGIKGRLALEFQREGRSAEEAVRSALRDVRRALPGATLIEAAPDLVGLAEVAELIGVSRQNMRKLMLAYPESFPAPLHEGSSSLWHLADVLAWLAPRGSYAVPEAALELATATMRVNLAREAVRLPASSFKRFSALVS